MGGNPPLGYDLPLSGTRALTVNADEAKTIRKMFDSYLHLGSVHTLLRQLGDDAIHSKARTSQSGKAIGGRPFSRGALYHLLRNRIYLGEIAHRDQSFPGLHPAIIQPEVFDSVQKRLDANARRHKLAGETVARSPLIGRIFDADDQPMSPTFSYGRSGRLYRYYVSAPLQQGVVRPPNDFTPRRVSAAALESRLQQAMIRFLSIPPADPLSIITRIEIHPGLVHLLLPLKYLSKLKGRLDPGALAEPDPAEPGQLRLTLPWRLQPLKGRTEIITTAPNVPQADPVLIKALRTAHAMLTMDAAKYPTLHVAPTSPWRRDLIRLAFLAPDIQTAILDGRQPKDLTLATLMAADFPILWTGQRHRFDIKHPV